MEEGRKEGKGKREGKDGWVREDRGGGGERKRWRGEEEADGNRIKRAG